MQFLFPFLLIALVATLICFFVPRFRKYLSYAVLIPIVFGTTYLPLAMYLLRFDWLREHLSSPGNGDYVGGLTWLGLLFVMACGLPGVAVAVLFIRWLRRERRPARLKST